MFDAPLYRNPTGLMIGQWQWSKGSSLGQKNVVSE